MERADSAVATPDSVAELRLRYEIGNIAWDLLEDGAASVCALAAAAFQATSFCPVH